MVTDADLRRAEDEQIAALEAARSAVADFRLGKINIHARRAAMEALERADAKLAELRAQRVREFAAAMNGKVEEK